LQRELTALEEELAQLSSEVTGAYRRLGTTVPHPEVLLAYLGNVRVHAAALRLALATILAPEPAIALHAEQNAIIYAGLDRTRGSVLYVHRRTMRRVRANDPRRPASARAVWPGGERTY
jgi:hypothetical protein